ncbi:MAG: CapA family protein [Flavobacteriaceae bacterium]|nr:CapA family protein [Flavobacteriaceae bacterium]
MKGQTTLHFFGDISLDGIYCEPQQHEVLSQNIKYLEQCLKPSDYKIVNWESMIWGNGEVNGLKSPRLCTTKEAASSILPLKIDLALIANNHVYDNGLSGFRNTIDFFEENNIKYIGASDSTSKIKPHLFTVNDISFAIFNFVGHETNPHLPEVCPVYLNFFDYNNTEVIHNQIKKYKNNVDHVIVALHWGEHELSRYPQERQRKFARDLIEISQVSLVVGHHVHCLQGYESFKNGFIAYSLGNFIFGPQLTLPGKIDSYRTSDTKKIGVLEITFTKTKIEKNKWHYFTQDRDGLLPQIDNLRKIEKFHLKLCKALQKKSINKVYKIEQKVKSIRNAVSKNNGIVATLLNLKLRHLKTLLK